MLQNAVSNPVSWTVDRDCSLVSVNCGGVYPIISKDPSLTYNDVTSPAESKISNEFILNAAPTAYAQLDFELHKGEVIYIAPSSGSSGFVQLILEDSPAELT